jgi:hypothetical protein
VAAAAVLVAVFVVRLGASGGSDDTAGLASPTEASESARSVTHASQDYTPESLTALTQSLAGAEAAFEPEPTPTHATGAGTAVPSPQPATNDHQPAAPARDLTEDEAVSCLERATGLTEGAEVLRLETATFQGRPAVIGVFRELREGGEEGAVLGMAADPSTCDPLFLTRFAP